MRKHLKHTLLFTFVLCGVVLLIACKNTKGYKENVSKTKVEATELLRTSQSWDGAELPDYLAGKPELVAMKCEIPAGKKLGWHHHDVLTYGVVTKGELTIIAQNGQTKVVHEGEAVVETVGTIHRGENRGDKTVVVYVFYASKKDKPLAIQHPEIPSK